MRTLLLLFFSVLLLHAQTYPSFSDHELAKIQKQNPIAKNRIIDYEEKMAIYKKLNKEDQLKRVNFYLNRLLPQYDSVTYKKEDNWATPKEFLRIGYGDCEDYALIKYYSLIRLGFDEKKLFITLVKEKSKPDYHMILTYFQNEYSSPLVLDNLSFKILTLQRRYDLKVKLFVNSTGVYKLNKRGKLTQVALKLKEFEGIQKKVKKNL